MPYKGKDLKLTIPFPTVQRVIFAANPKTSHGKIDYDAQTGNFTVGSTLSGGTSLATAIILADNDAGTTGTLTLGYINGTFQDNETITDAVTGSATSNGIVYDGDIGGRVRITNAAYTLRGEYIGKLVGFDNTNKYWWIETTKTIPASSYLKIDGTATGVGQGQMTAATSITHVEKYLTLDGYTDCVLRDLGKIVTDDGGDVGPLVDYDNDGQKWVIAGATGTIADNSVMAITGGTGAGDALGASLEEIVLTVVDALGIELIREGGIEYVFGSETGEMGFGNRHGTFTLKRMFYEDTDKDILFDLFNGKIAFDLEGTLKTLAGAEIPNSQVRLRKCYALRWRPVTGTANDTIGEEVVGEAEDWIKITPID